MRWLLLIKNMVVTAQHEATDVGLEILRHGGNAVDAAVAIGYALAVTYLSCGNLGGGGFMTIHCVNGKDTFINFREKAPLRARRDMYLDANGNVIPGLSTVGYLAVAVPGTPAGLEYALQRYGTLSRAAVIGPAIGLAINGFVLGQGDVDLLYPPIDSFRTQPNVSNIFLKGGKPYQVGDRLLQPELGRTLILLALFGPMAFYQGPIADKIADASSTNGGILSKRGLFELFRRRIDAAAKSVSRV